MSAPFKRGDAVICIDATPNAADPKAFLLVERRTYRVGAAAIRPDGVFALAFHCLKSGDVNGWAFSATRFRKLDEDIGFDFREQLRAKPKELSPAAPTGERTARAVPIPSGAGGHPSTPETV